MDKEILTEKQAAEARLADSLASLKASQAKRDAKMKKEGLKGYPEKDAHHKFIYHGVPCCLVRKAGYRPCGYARFPKSFTLDDYNSILRFVPVHGGITFARRDLDGSVVLGFDTSHHNSPPNPIQEWMQVECQEMVQGALAAKEYAKEYHEATKEGRMAIAEKINGETELNFGTMLWALGGCED